MKTSVFGQCERGGANVDGSGKLEGGGGQTWMAWGHSGPSPLIHANLPKHAWGYAILHVTHCLQAKWSEISRYSLTLKNLPERKNLFISQKERPDGKFFPS